MVFGADSDFYILPGPVKNHYPPNRTESTIHQGKKIAECFHPALNHLVQIQYIRRYGFVRQHRKLIIFVK
ncbi:hypothetical protein CH371_12670 [Leptospira wolffii]|uniref:Uncharacterized protein n=1 Tax=Leptospira wolffii TaxID=409998 RepID=A0A2M9ZBH6_9LEPT|nr:hypothetical protein CH371_12670 [Leptospira wolffii]